MWNKEFADCLSYIDSYWDKVTHKPARKKINHHIITIPHPYISPNDKWVGKFGYMFYWDTFFIFRGLIGTKREWLLKEMVNNFVYIYTRYGIIPNFNAPVSMGRSQPPFFTSMILDTYNGYFYEYLRKPQIEKVFYNLRRHKKWLTYTISVAKREYETVWMDHEKLYNHSVKDHFLARYGDRDIGYAHSSELESGWDFTSRFFNRCNQFFPIDLNVLLYKYERDFAKVAVHLGDIEEKNKWQQRAKKRKEEINKFMWDEEKGFFFDYGYVYQRISDFMSLASFTPLWAGLATAEQAARMVRKLPNFETEYGLTITDQKSLAQLIDLSKVQRRYHPAIEEIIKPKQWDYPNSWPPLEYLAVIGLLKYGYVDDAIRLMKKYISAHAALFRKYGTFMEKINGVTGERAEHFSYELQSGFGWTNAVFYRYVQILDSIESGDDIYRTPKAEHAPYKLAILH